MEQHQLLNDKEPMFVNHILPHDELNHGIDMGDPRGYILSLNALNWSCEGRDSGSSFLGYVDYSPTALTYIVSLFPHFISMEMSFRGRKFSYPHST
jgi:hypothetical protein